MFITILLLSTAYRLFYSPDVSILKYSTFSVLSDFMFGSFFAYAAQLIPNAKEFLGRLPRATSYIAALIALVLMPLFTLAEGQAASSVGMSISKVLVAFFPLVFSLLFAFIISRESFVFKELSGSVWSRILIYLGTISYGLYCYHGIAMLAVKVLALTKLSAIIGNTGLYAAEAILAFSITVTGAALSFKYLEKPILALKEKFNVLSH